MSFEEYKKALKAGQKSYHEYLSEGKYPYLPSLLEMLPKGVVLQEVKLGLCDIPIELISGTYTEGRQNAFAPNFMPLLDIDTEFAAKWSALNDAHIKEGIHDPVTCYEYRNHFYICEGNKRVSVLKYNGAVSVPGEVIRIMPEKNQAVDNIIYYEFVDFYKDSQINYLLFSKPGSYAKLTELVGKTPGQQWDDEDKEYFYSFFYRFRNIYEEKGGDKLPGTVGDAILVYIDLMGYENVKKKTPSEIREDLKKIWSEFGVMTQDKVELVMEPEDLSNLLVNINKMFPLPISRKIKVAFVHDKTGETSAWTYAHELGRMYVDEVLSGDIETKAYMNALDGEGPEKILEEVISEGYKIIFTTTPQLNAASLRVAIEHPDVKILNCSLNISHSYIRTYYARLHEAKLLTGIIAGAMADHNLIGYVADYPIAGTVANINAFALGAQMANPRAKIVLKWSSVEKGDLVRMFNEHGITVCSGQDMINPGSDRRVFGVNILKEGKLENVATAVTDWGKLYEKIIRAAINGNAIKTGKAPKSFNYWFGLDAGVVDVICSTRLENGTKRLIDLVRNDIANGSFKPFEGELYAQGGQLIQKEGILSPDELVSMEWLNENIIGDIPKLSELKPEARPVALLQSIDKTVKE